MSWYPRPAAPKALWADIRAFTAERSRYQWAGLAVAVTMPLLIVAGFLHDSAHRVQQGPEIIYAESWPANRSDAEIKADQKRDQIRREAAIRERQRQFRKLDKDLHGLGI
ncbi:MAG: hypothetical protein JWO81_1022 [Alphaproteobacteria bacterium]|nr:hypothetical protein [Alphaproteobacteria bacterium]